MGQFYSNNNKDLLKAIHKTNCILGDEESLNDDGVINEYVIDKQNKNDFHLTHTVNSKGCSTLICKICGDDKFIVGQESYFTAVKCVTCGYEAAIHVG